MPEQENTEIVARMGPVEVDVPKSIGYFGGIGLAVWMGMIEPPLGLFIASIPLVKLLNRPRATRPEQAVFGLVDGAAKPVGGDSEGVVRFSEQAQWTGRWFGFGGLFDRIGDEARTIWVEAQHLR
jgi:hypothetical protein